MQLLQRRWIAGHLLALTMAGLFVGLGSWQLARNTHKHDLVADTRRSHDFGGGRQPGALVFVADPDRSRAEDGGWLVGFVHGETGHDPDLVVLDAQAIERPAIAVVNIPRRIPRGAQGTWIPAVRI